MNKNKLHLLTQAAMIAALYVVLTFIANAFGLANYAVQVRFSEALTILPLFTPSAVPGLFLGCLISNILTGCALPDIVFGSAATLIGALGTRKLAKWFSQKSFPVNALFAALPPILANTVIVPFVLRYAYGIRPLWLSFLTVGAGEVISCGILGLLLACALNRYRSRLFS